ncbi:tubulin polyglutamylase TTLL4 isoform X2 [Drosophila obscura]|uniref:tubulin polyglutamylase TTLL4 isoform X2 n=1 Tax=Drosophila obscura TaxID=7282 RepID=UPI001BB27FC5|nr:tubulin polyglutamylase TTLL4 isoform X2 [Drosophila obscura]
MAQITEKRTTNGRPGGAGATKENMSSHQQQQATRGKGIEILDFHESWLEEVEIYKDKMVMCKQLAHHNHQPSASRSAPGPGHGKQPAVQRSSAGASSISGINRTMSSVSAAARSPPPSQKQRTPPPAARRRSAIEKGSSVSTAASTASSKTTQRILIRGPAAATKGTPMSVATGVLQSEPYKKVQRARDEAFAKHVAGTNSNGNSKQGGGNSNSHSSSVSATGGGSKLSSLSPARVEKGVELGGISHAISSISCTSTQTLTPGSKIVVNTFHGSSLLAQQHDEKSRILTQNGLTKSAATALETSLYASLYAHSPLNSGSQYSASATSRMMSGGVEHAAYGGVSLNKGNHDNIRLHEDDPCAAIDDINNYDDSDSEEEYVGTPFFLDEDETETHQSRHTRLLPEKSASKESMATIDSEASVYFRPDAILSPSLFPNVPPYLNFTSHADKGPPMPAALHRVLKWKLSPVMPKIVKRVVLNSGFRIIKNTTDWMAVWEKHMKSPGFRTIRSHQKYNHIPGSFRIGRKDTMWRSIYQNLKKFGKKDFGFMQKSYIMPDDLENLRQVWPKNASKLTKWIVKPPASARGTGIRIVNKWSQFPKDRPLVVQKYIERPLLINDNKFDMRLYVVLTSINPLRIYMYKDGLARFASVKYSSELSNLDERCMHLTNYSINKFSQNYAKNEDFNACQGHKWTLQSLWSCLENRGVNTKRLWATLRNLVIKGIVSGESGLNRMYRQNVNFRYNCFELFGFDVLLDENLVPWLLEINISPSLHSELPLDLHVKGPLIQAVLNTALYQVPPKLNERQQQEILEELNMKGPLCHDKRIFTTCLTAEEVRKHNQFTNRSIEFREEYVDTILDNLLPDDVRCLIIAEDEQSRCRPLERIFPTSGTHIYLRYIENARYYNRLLDAWETKYSKNRELGVALLSRYCKDKYHLQVSDAAMEKEPNVALTEIDMLHVKKDDVLDGATTLARLNLVPTEGSESVPMARSPEACIEIKS